MLWKQLEGSSPEEAHLLDSRLLQWSFNQPDSVEGGPNYSPIAPTAISRLRHAGVQRIMDLNALRYGCAVPYVQ